MNLKLAALGRAHRNLVSIMEVIDTLHQMDLEDTDNLIESHVYNAISELRIARAHLIHAKAELVKEVKP